MATPDQAALPQIPPLTLWLRIALLVSGWLLLLLGLLGLVLPGLQGVLTLILGGATLSLVSHRALRILQRTLRPWPKAWLKLLQLREGLLRRLPTQKPMTGLG
jgi:uncharacterized membrane protein YbaN (DUF454 family)